MAPSTKTTVLLLLSAHGLQLQQLTFITTITGYRMSANPSAICRTSVKSYKSASEGTVLVKASKSAQENLEGFA